LHVCTRTTTIFNLVLGSLVPSRFLSRYLACESTSPTLSERRVWSRRNESFPAKSFAGFTRHSMSIFPDRLSPCQSHFCLFCAAVLCYKFITVKHPTLICSSNPLSPVAPSLHCSFLCQKYSPFCLLTLHTSRFVFALATIITHIAKHCHCTALYSA
jgi:hypothetical protein